MGKPKNSEPAPQHYLEAELYKRVQTDPAIFDFIQEGSLDGIWYWDLEQPDNEWMSTRFWEIFGYNPANKKHLASEWQTMINQDDLNTAIDNFTQHVNDPNHPYDQIVRYTHKDGHTVWVRCRGIAIRDESGKAIRMLGAHTDVTKLKETEAELLERNTELSRFAHAASHDLQSPLVTISTHLDLIKESIPADDPETALLIDNTVDAAQRMQNQIQGLLNYAEMSATSNFNDTCDMEAILKDTLSDHQSLIDEKGAKVSHSSLPKLKGNQTLIRQLFTNLIGNALKYGKKDTAPKIDVSATQKKQHWEFVVADNGQGIPKKDYDKVFDMFSRRHRWSEVKGSGLGLSLCKKAVQKHGGNIWITSDSNGTHFHFTIPHTRR